MAIFRDGIGELRALIGGGEARDMTRATVPEILFPEATSGEVITPRSALTMLDVFAAVRRLADGVSALPLVTYRRNGDARERATDAPIARLIDRPAPGVTQAALIGTLVAHLAGWGNAYIGKFRDETGAVAQLAPLPPDQVNVQIVGGQPFYSYADPTGRQAVYTTTDIVHIRSLSLDGRLGVSPIRQAREDLGLAAAVRDSGAAFYANDARPAGIVVIRTAGPDADEIAANVQKDFEKRHKGSANRGRLAFLQDVDIGYTALSVSLADAEWINARKLSRVDVCTLFGLPAWMLNADAGTSQTYSNVTEQSRAFLQWSLRPYTTAIEQAVASDDDLCPAGSGLFVEFLYDAAMRGSSAERAAVYTQALAGGWMTPNEVRRAENLPPLPGGDAPAPRQTQPIPREAIHA